MPHQNPEETVNNHDMNQVTNAFQKLSERVGCRNLPLETVRVANYPSEEWLSEIQRRTPSNTGRPLEDVLREADEIFSYRISTKHPRFFAFIPSPVSPVSWLGDSLTSAYNTYAGSSESGSGVCAVERSMIAWIAEQFGLPSSAGGQFVSGASMATLTAVTVARDQRLSVGLRPKATVYISDESHFCIIKALRIIGFLDSQIRTIRCDSKYRMDTDYLRRAISKDTEDALKPFLVVATCGTTSTGAIDSLNEIADIADEHGLWMHVDAAYGGSAAFSSTHRSLVNGLGRADSIAWDPHKWLFQTYGCGAILFREKSHPLKSFASTAHFCRDFEDEKEPQNPWNYGIELTRPARHMRLWFSLQVLGMDTIDKMIGRGFELSAVAEGEIKKLADWIILAPTSLAIVNFRFAPHGLIDDLLDQVNTRVSKDLAAENIACILTTHLGGVVGLRMCTINPRTTDDDIRRVVSALDRSAQGVYEELSKRP
ncbi:pyridoxal phosphate-dependent transferase [Aspergillus caelatus]|uniref:Pyridoxal phosphate-dependent transferase n=1 Tax=Aspergillus caelatus TaxID=61420 RepID=A0A5N7AE89_9EURO|nr:pyridoxal phosphate-dependent transferase [Aspergillus caelatus]KAE8368025.1 pyridoxal phosphate-dependent transferase [Aspergillus caelatus]